MRAGELADAITEVRARDPERVKRLAESRRRRVAGGGDGRLVMLAADHPARGVVGIGSDPLAMADRADFLARIIRALQSPEVDGVMATMDVLEDLLIAASLLGEETLAGGRVLVASINRGGLAGTAWELDDPATGPSPRTCKELSLDGGKVLLRIAPDEPASLKTITACAEAITGLAREGLAAFLEPLPVGRDRPDGRWVVLREPEALARIVSIAQALGETSRHTWLKLPYCEGFETVARATTLPILLLGGPDPANGFLEEVARATSVAKNVRGAMAGRFVLYPPGGDPLVAATALGAVVHEGLDPASAAERGAGAAEFARYLVQLRGRP